MDTLSAATTTIMSEKLSPPSTGFVPSGTSPPMKSVVLTIVPRTVVSDDAESSPKAESPSYSDIIDVPADTFDHTVDRHFFGGYGEWGHVITHGGHSILNDLKQYPFPDDIKNQADVIYNKMIYRVRRGKIRDQMLFYCVYCAHLELRRPVNIVSLGAQFNLTQGEVQRCDSIFSPLQTGYRPPTTNTSPLQYLPDYCHQIGLSSDAVEEVISLARSILTKDPTLCQENPQTVAAGLLRYYIFTSGIICEDSQLISRVTGRSNVTIEGMFRRIVTVDNS